MIDPTSKLSINRQARVLGISRGSVYYQPRPISDADLKLLHRIDKLDTSKNLWANQDLIDSICLVAEERRHGRSIPGTF